MKNELARGLSPYSEKSKRSGPKSSPMSLSNTPRTTSSTGESQSSTPVRKTDRLISSSSLDSTGDWDDLPAGFPSPADPSTPSPSGDISFPNFARMATLPEGARFQQHKAQMHPNRGEGTRHSRMPKPTKAGAPKLKKVSSAKERTFSSSTSPHSLLALRGAVPADVAAEVEGLRCQLADEQERVEGLRERKELLAAESKRARAERDQLAREQGRLTEKVAHMEGQMLDLKETYEKELAAARQMLAFASKPLTGSAANENMALVEQVQLLTQENEGLRRELLEATRGHRALAAERDAADARANAMEMRVRDLLLEREREKREWKEEHRRMEFMLNDADAQAEKRARDVDAARRDAREQRQMLQDLRQDMEGKLAAAEARIAHQEFEVAAALDRADTAEAAREELLHRTRGGYSSGVDDERVRELESEAERLITRLNEKEMEVRRERGLRDFAEAEHREMREAMETQADMIRDKIKALKKEKEMAVAACEKRMATMQREIGVLVDQKEAHQDAGKKARASVEKAEQYLKALDVARVEVKRLRLERDLLTERIRTLEKNDSKGGGGGVGVGWFMPECLLKRAQDCAQVAPIGPLVA